MYFISLTETRWRSIRWIDTKLSENLHRFASSDKFHENNHYITENISLRNNLYLEKRSYISITTAQERMQHPVDRKGGSSFGSDVFAWYPFTGVDQDFTKYLKNV